MSVAAAILLFILGLNFEFSLRKKLGLGLSSRSELKSFFREKSSLPYHKALRALFFSGICLLAFGIWEACIRAVLSREWGWWSFGVGLLLGLSLLLLRQKNLKSSAGSLWSQGEVLLYAGTIFFLLAPLLSIVFSIWFFIRYYLLLKAKSKIPSAA